MLSVSVELAGHESLTERNKGENRTVDKSLTPQQSVIREVLGSDDGGYNTDFLLVCDVM